MDRKRRALIVSGRMLVAEGLMSLLEEIPEIGHTEIAESLYEAMVAASHALPDVVVVDLPPGADYFVNRPMQFDGKEIKTIILQESEYTGEARMYVYTPGEQANFQNLLAAIVSGKTDDSTAGKTAARKHLANVYGETAPAIPVEPQPSNLISASVSSPKRSRIAPSNP